MSAASRRPRGHVGAGPGTLRYRLDDRSTFLAAMRSALASLLPGAPARPTAAGLDPADALLDAWATIADVLSFYSERLANENYLATAIEDQSLRQLAKSVGYDPAPAVAAFVHLAFMIEATADADVGVVVPAGTSAQSTPQPGEQPQSYETLDDLTGRPSWNRLPVRTRTVWSTPVQNTLWVKPDSPHPAPDDVLLLFAGDHEPAPWRVRRVTPIPGDVIEISVAPVPQQPAAAPPAADPGPASRVTTLRAIATTDPDRAAAVLDSVTLSNPARGQTLQADVQSAGSGARQMVWLGARATLFGAGAPPQPIVVKGRVQGYAERVRADATGWRISLDLSSSVVTLGVSRTLREAATATLALPLREYGVRPRLLAGKPIRVTLPAGGSPQLLPAGIILDGDPSIDLTIDVPVGGSTVSVTPADGAAAPPIGALGGGAHQGPAAIIVPLGEMRRVIVAGRQLLLRYAPTGPKAAAGSRGIFTVDTADPSDIVTLEGLRAHPAADSWVALTQDGVEQVPAAKVQKVDDVTASDYGSAQRVNRVRLDRPLPMAPDFAGVRGTTVLLESSRLEPAAAPPQPGDVLGVDPLILAGIVPGLTAGQTIAVTASSQGPRPGDAGELAVIGSVGVAASQSGDAFDTVIRLAKPLQGRYPLTSVAVWGNVAEAIAGTTWTELLGSGTGAPLQSFVLQHAPLTWRPSSFAARSLEPDLTVIVDGVQWHLVDRLRQLGPDGRGYVLSEDESGRATLKFGDGRTGLRVPAGRNNVQATYRSGGGMSGNLTARRIDRLRSRPLGVTGVVNPVAASGGSDPESTADLRRRASSGLSALGRVVALADYEDIALEEPELAKARAQAVQGNSGLTVLVTVAGTTSAALPPDATVLTTLQQLVTSRNAEPDQSVVVVPRRLGRLVLTASLRARPDWTPARITQDVTAALVHAFGYPVTRLGDGIRLSTLVSVLQRLAGVEYALVLGVDVVDGDADIDATGQSLDMASAQDIPGDLGGLQDGQYMAARLVIFDPAQPGALRLDIQQ